MGLFLQHSLGTFIVGQGAALFLPDVLHINVLAADGVHPGGVLLEHVPSIAKGFSLCLHGLHHLALVGVHVVIALCIGRICHEDSQGREAQKGDFFCPVFQDQ